MEELDWPPQSPDLTPSNTFGDKLDGTLTATQPFTLCHCPTSLMTMWLNDSKSPARLQNLVESLLRRVKGCYNSMLMPSFVRSEIHINSYSVLSPMFSTWMSNMMDMTLSWALLYFWCHCCPLTLIQPVSKPIEDDSLLTSGNQADRSALYCCSIVDVVFKYEDLDREMQKGEPSLVSVSLYVA